MKRSEPKRKAKCPKCGTLVTCAGKCYMKPCSKCGWDVYFSGHVST